jgi:hypothetical protein
MHPQILRKSQNFQLSQRMAVFEIDWKEFGQDLEFQIHLEPEDGDEDA